MLVRTKIGSTRSVASPRQGIVPSPNRSVSPLKRHEVSFMALHMASGGKRGVVQAAVFLLSVAALPLSAAALSCIPGAPGAELTQDGAFSSTTSPAWELGSGWTRVAI